MENNHISYTAENNNSYLFSYYQKDNCLLKDSILINILPVTEPDIFIDPSEPYFIGDTVFLQIENANTGFDSIKWYFNQTKYSSENPVSYTLADELTEIYLQIINSKLCLSDTIFSINASLKIPLFPNAIIPGDEENGYFRIFNTGKNIKLKELLILDRWGKIVFNCSDINCALSGWDGTFNGKPCPPSVYLYSSKIILPDNSESIIKGTLQILK